MGIFKSFVAFCILLPSFAIAGTDADGRFYVYLTWQNETISDRITVNFQHTALSFEESIVRYDTESNDGVPEAYAYSATGYFDTLDGISRQYHHIRLFDLEPDTVYYFVVGDDSTGYSQEYSFRTLPAEDSDEPLRFIQGGDIGTGQIVATMFDLAAATNPHMALIGGDIAYADGKSLSDWDDWFALWQDHMVTPDGHLIPIIAAIGNHETDSFFFSDAKFYFNAFNQGGSSLFRRYLRDNAVLYTLDSGHTRWFGPHQAGKIDDWMEEDAEIPLKMAMYHIPLYPSHRNYLLPPSCLVRASWRGAFDRHGLTVGFENHDHTFKRTKRLKRGKIVEEGGTVYVGDGAFGHGPRTVVDRWYLEKAIATLNFWYGEIHTDDTLVLRAYNDLGEEIDYLVLP